MRSPTDDARRTRRTPLRCGDSDWQGPAFHEADRRNTDRAKVRLVELVRSPPRTGVDRRQNQGSLRSRAGATNDRETAAIRANRAEIRAHATRAGYSLRSVVRTNRLA